VLTHLRIAREGTVQLEHAGGRRFLLFLRDASVAGELQVAGDVQLTVGGAGTTMGEKRAKLAVPETIPFSRRGEGIVPVSVQATLGDESWFLKDVPVRGLSVNRQEPGEPGNVAFVSAVKDGSLTLPDVSREITLRERDHLRLDGLSGLLLETRLDGDSIHMLFQGTAAMIHLGPSGYSTNLAPTYLEYLYHNRPLVLFWTGLTFLGGTLWSIRRTFFE
jgi:hypothetical protein